MTRSAPGGSGHPRVDDFPGPVISVAIEPRTKADQEKLSTAIQRLAEEDPTFQVPPTTTPGRPSSPGWANCTSRCWSTG